MRLWMNSLLALGAGALSYWAGSYHHDLVAWVETWEFSDPSAPARATASPPATRERPIKLQVMNISSGGRQCDVMLLLRNGTIKTIDSLAGDMVIESEAGRESGSFRFEYLDPGKEVLKTVRFYKDCDESKPIEFRAVSFCQIGGKYYSDCGKIIEVQALRGKVQNYMDR